MPDFCSELPLHKGFLALGKRKVDMMKVKDWLEGIPSPNTEKSYRNGIEKFEQF